ncbi:MAG: hypothetical protein AAGB51_06265 [Planctomycetota bacterium]
MLSRIDEARDAALLEAVGMLILEVDKQWPKDTNRSMNGFIEAANDVGVDVLRPREIEKSGYLDRIIRRLREAADEAERRAKKIDDLLTKWFDSRGLRGNPWPKKMDRRRRRLERAAKRMREEAEKAEASPSGAVILRDDAGVLGGRFGYGRRGRLTSTVITKVYGGYGVKLVRDNVSVIELHNQEPHATFIERRLRILFTATGVVGRATHVRRVKRRFAQELGATIAVVEN